MDDTVHAAGDRGADDPEWVRLRERRVEQVLRRANFAAHLGESLAQVAGDLVALLDGGGGTAGVVRSLQAAAAPAGSYIPPAEQSTALAAAVVAACESVGQAPDAAG